MTEEAPQEMSPGQRWKEELSAAKEWLKPWHESGRAILKRLKDVRPKDSEIRRVNLFTAEYLTKRAILYGRTPVADVSRRFKDSEDDIARVGASMMRRLLNDDIASGVDGYGRALGYALENRLSVGLGLARVRYEVKTEQYQEASDASGQDPAVRVAPDGSGSAMGAGRGGVVVFPGGEQDAAPGPQHMATPPPERVSYECVKVDYVYWEDFLWSPCRYWEVARWVAFKTEMSRKALVKRFGAAGASIPFDATPPRSEQKKDQPEPPWGRAVVWEIWDKEDKQVVWVTEAGQVLDARKDFYHLKDFFPCPRPIFSLITTDEMIPRPDYCLAEDLYGDLDTLSTRMHLLRTALRVVGMYDAENKDLAELMNNTAENRMVPVKNWAMLSEKGGIAGAVQFFPIQEVAATLLSLSQEYTALEQRLYQVTGFSDILRGQGAAAAVTATEQRIKANFGSARLQSVQDDFARFATELQGLKYEMICRHYSAEEIVRQSNMLRTPDAMLALQAAEFLKNESEAFRVKVQPETLALSDFSALKEERMEVVTAIGQYIAAATPLLQVAPTAAPALLEILKWLVAALRGAAEIEGILDKAISMAQQMAQQGGQPGQQQPDMGKMLSEQVKAQGAIAKVKAESEARKEEIGLEVQADAVREENQMRYNVEEHARKQAITNTMRPPQPNGGMPR